MTNAEQRIIHLEQLVKTQANALASLQAQVAALQQALRTIQAGGYGGGGAGATVYTIAPVAIAAGGNVTNQTVSVLQGGASTTVTTTATVYNQMAVTTVSTAGKTIIVGPNGDGTYTAITQSC